MILQSMTQKNIKKLLFYWRGVYADESIYLNTKPPYCYPTFDVASLQYDIEEMDLFEENRKKKVLELIRLLESKEER